MPRVSPKTSRQNQVKHIKSQSPPTSQTREFIGYAPECIPVFLTSPMEAQVETVHQIHTHSKTRSLEIIHKLTARTLPSHKGTLDFTISKLPSSTNRLLGQYSSWMLCPTSLQIWSLIQTRMTRLSPTTNSLLQSIWSKPVHNLGSCIVYMHKRYKIYRVLCQVTDTKGYFILCRERAQQINYIQYLEIQPPICTFTPETSLKTIAVENNK